MSSGSSSSVNLRDLLGSQPSSPEISNYLTSIYSLVSPSKTPLIPEIKSYPDAVYFNYYPIGVSLLFVPQNEYKPPKSTGPPVKRSDLKEHDLILESIDIYNIPKDVKVPQSKRTTELAFSTYPVSPITLTLNPDVQLKDKDGKPLSVKRPSQLSVVPTTPAVEFVTILGEPDRKGGGAGPSSGSIGIWCQWSRDGIMVEFGGDEARGPQAWERGKDAVWKIVTVFAWKEEGETRL